MNMDTIVLTFKSVATKMKSDLSDAISKWQSLSNETSKASNSIKQLGTPLDTLKNKLKATQNEYNNLKKSIELFSPKYGVREEARNLTGLSTDDLRKNYEMLNNQSDNLMNSIVKKSQMLDTFKDTSLYDKGLSKIEKLKEQWNEVTKKVVDYRDALQFREDTGTSYDNAIDSLKLYQEEIDLTKEKIKELSMETNDMSVNEKYDLVDKDVEEVGDSAQDSSKKFKDFKKSVSSTGNAFSQLSSTMKSTRRLFNSFHNSFGKGMDSTFKKVRKLALGLIGVRTVMSLLTKSVNAYLSFDSELQDSLKNSWNTLGALLAPAIETVANLFATATTYVAQFVQALSGIDLVARANAKAYETQAKATQKAANAQRGLLGMDEITNLPTETGVSNVPQILKQTIEPNEFFNSIVDAFKTGNWHILGENIGRYLSNGMKAIPWDDIKRNAYAIGKNIASFLNGWFEFGWADLGITAANGLNTVFDILGGFVNDFSFIQFGKGISTALTNFFTTVEWDKVATTLSNGVLGILNTIKAIFKDKKNQDAIGNAIADFVKNIKWFEIGKSIAETIAAGFRAGFNLRDAFFKGIFGKDLGGAISGFTTLTDPFKLIGSGFSWLKGLIGLDTGTEQIKTEGLYHLHEGEMVVPKRYNPSTSGINTSQDNKQIIDLLISLNSSMIEYANRPIALNMDGKRVAEGTYGYLQDINRNENKSTVVVRS